MIRWLPAFGRFGLSGGRLFPSAYETCFKSRHSEPKGNSCCRQSSSLLLRRRRLRRRRRCRRRRRRCQVLLPTRWLQLEGLVYLSTMIGPTHTVTHQTKGTVTFFRPVHFRLTKFLPVHRSLTVWPQAWENTVLDC